MTEDLTSVSSQRERERDTKIQRVRERERVEAYREEWVEEEALRGLGR